VKFLNVTYTCLIIHTVLLTHSLAVRGYCRSTCATTSLEQKW